MSYILTQQAFSGKIKSIKSTRAKFSEDVQAALIAATYLCIANSGGTTPLQQVLDAVGTTAHRKGVTTWLETFAPAMMKDGKVVSNKTAYKGLDVDAIKADFSAYVVETGMDEVKWDAIAADKNTTESIFNLDTTLDAFCKKLEKNNLSELAARIRQTEQDYMAAAIKAAMGVSPVAQ